MIAVLVISIFVWMGQGLRLDEAQSIWQTSRDLSGVVRIVAKDVHVPFYFVALHFWEVLFGTGEKAVRFLSLIAFVASIPAMFVLAQRAYSTRVAYYSALLTAVSPFLNWYGSEARMYSLLFLVTALSHMCFISLWKAPTRGLWAAYAAVTLVGAATHPFFGFILLSQAIFFFAWRGLFPAGSLRRFGSLAAVVIALAAYWGVYRHLAGAGLSNPALSTPTSVDFFNVFSNFFIGFQTDAINTFFLSLWPVLVFVAFTLLDKKHQSEPETAYFMMASFIPIALAFVVSVAVTPLFLSRYLIVALPSLYLLSIHFLSTYKDRVAKATLGALCILSLVMLFVQAVDPRSPVKEDYRDAAHYVTAHAKADDLFIVSAPFTTYPVEYYYDGSARLATFPRWDRFDQGSLPEAYSPDLIERDSKEWEGIYRDVYMLFGYDQGYQEDVRLYMDTHYQRVDMKTFSPGLSLYVYRLRYL
jgi:Predicted membrane protein